MKSVQLIPVHILKKNNLGNIIVERKILLYIGDSYIKYRSGIAAYHWNVINTIAQEYDIVFSNKPDKDAEFPSNANIIIQSAIKRKIISIFKLFLPFDIFFAGYDIIITDSFTPLKANKKTKIITIVHDLMGLTENNNYSVKSRLYIFFSVITYKRADKIIAVSNNTKNDLIRLLQIKPDKIVKIQNVTKFFVISNKTENIFIYIGEMRKNKNLENTILGFIKFKERTNSSVKLVICGKKEFEYPNLLNVVSSCKYEKDILFTGYLSDAQKEEYFSKTKGLVLLSNNEGFGIPVIEAATNFIPILASDIPIMHEVLSDVGIFINQRSITAIAKGFSLLDGFQANEEFISRCNILKKKYSVSTFEKLINGLLEQFVL